MPGGGCDVAPGPRPLGNVNLMPRACLTMLADPPHEGKVVVQTGTRTLRAHISIDTQSPQ
jgi:hypothetical protein